MKFSEEFFIGTAAAGAGVWRPRLLNVRPKDYALSNKWDSPIILKFDTYPNQLITLNLPFHNH